jgi:hypothetical protein
MEAMKPSPISRFTDMDYHNTNNNHEDKSEKDTSQRSLMMKQKAH